MNKTDWLIDEVSTITFFYNGDLPPTAIIDLFLRHQALDVFFIPVCRPQKQGYEVYILCLQKQEAYFIHLLAENFSTQYQLTRQHRYKLQRDFVEIQFHDYPVQVKYGYAVVNGKKNYFQIKPEYEDCKKLAIILNRTLEEIYEQSKAKAYQVLST
jgi:uncharacterized protein (DUF111 family)